MLTVTIMGCGASAGVPSIGNHWGNCDPDEPKNRRQRSGVAVQSKTTNVVVDTGPDFRNQINSLNIKWIDGVLYTHAHGDHVSGIDDLRPLRMRHKKLIDIYAMPETLTELKLRFGYLFTQKSDLYPQVIVPHLIVPSHYGLPIQIGDIVCRPFDQDHTTCRTLGFRFGSIGYSTDMVALGDKALKTLVGIDTWIVDGGGYKMTDHLVHANLATVYELNKEVKARRVVLTHMTPAMDYKTLLRELPSGYEPAYDGMILKAGI